MFEEEKRRKRRAGRGRKGRRGSSKRRTSRKSRQVRREKGVKSKRGDRKRAARVGSSEQHDGKKAARCCAGTQVREQGAGWDTQVQCALYNTLFSLANSKAIIHSFMHIWALTNFLDKTKKASI